MKKTKPKKTARTRILIRRHKYKYQWLVVSRWDHSTFASGFERTTNEAKLAASLARAKFEKPKKHER